MTLSQVKEVHRVNVHIFEGSVCRHVWFKSDQSRLSALTDVTVAIERIAPTFPDVTSEPVIEIAKVETQEPTCTPNIE